MTKNSKLPNSENKIGESRRFESVQDLWNRFDEIKRSPSSLKNKKTRAKIIKQYERTNEVATNGKKQVISPNFGGFQARVDSLAQKIFDISTERSSLFGIKFIDLPEDLELERKNIEEKVTDCWHSKVNPHVVNFANHEKEDSLQLSLFGSVIKYWPLNSDKIYSSDAHIDRVFPNSNAKKDPKTWDYVFIEVDYTLHELKEIASSGKSGKSLGWSLDQVNQVIENPHAGSRDDKDEESIFTRGDKIASDYVIPIVIAYVKEYSGKISLYAFPSERVFYGKKGKQATVNSFLRYLDNAGNCMSDFFAVRTFTPNEPYWKMNSYAKQIYSALAFSNKSMNMIIRAAIRNSALWIKTGNAATRKALEASDGKEVQMLGPEDDFAQVRVSSEIGQIAEVMRAVIAENDSNYNFGISSGPSQTTLKGYPVTAEEATISFNEKAKGIGAMLKVLFGNDMGFLSRIFFRSLGESHLNGKDKKVSEILATYCKNLVDKKYLSEDNITVVPAYNLALASPQAREQNSNKLIQALSFNPTTPGQELAQRELIGTYVGASNVDYYLSRTEFILDMQRKVGAENEDMDNPMLNRANVPVLPNDKHLIEIPIHLSDYEAKLQMALSLINKAKEHPPLRKMILLEVARGIIEAQDNKGGHIEAHLNIALSQDPGIKDSIKPILEKFDSLRKDQDELQASIEQEIIQIESSGENAGMNDLEYEHKKRMYELEFKASQDKSNMALQTNVEKKEIISEGRRAKLDAQKESAGIKSSKEYSGIETERSKAEIEKQKEAIKVAAAREKAEIELTAKRNKANEARPKSKDTSP